MSNRNEGWIRLILLSLPYLHKIEKKAKEFTCKTCWSVCPLNDFELETNCLVFVTTSKGKLFLIHFTIGTTHRKLLSLLLTLFGLYKEWWPWPQKGQKFSEFRLLFSEFWRAAVLVPLSSMQNSLWEVLQLFYNAFKSFRQIYPPNYSRRVVCSRVCKSTYIVLIAYLLKYYM